MDIEVNSDWGIEVIREPGETSKQRVYLQTCEQLNHQKWDFHLGQSAAGLQGVSIWRAKCTYSQLQVVFS